MGNNGVIDAGEWMTAGKGIIHQEMPKGDRAGMTHGLRQLAVISLVTP
jgi:quercetin 2,3-dioxygenase